jgi:hypothetical protein
MICADLRMFGMQEAIDLRSCTSFQWKKGRICAGSCAERSHFQGKENNLRRPTYFSTRLRYRSLLTHLTCPICPTRVISSTCPTHPTRLIVLGFLKFCLVSTCFQEWLTLRTLIILKDYVSRKCCNHMKAGGTHRERGSRK